jgi:Tfp pilus assembly protein PilF
MFKAGIWISVGLLLISLAGLATPAAAQRVATADNGTGGGAINGQIIVPVPGFWDYIEVVLEYETGIPVAYAHTDSSGNYTFNNLQPGRYFVLVELSGFDKVRERIDLTPGELMPPLRIYLVPDGEKAASAEMRRKYPKKAVDEYEKGQDELRKGDLAKSLQRLNNAIKEAPMFFEAHLLLGTVNYKLKKMVDAETSYQKARELDPKSTQAMLNLGQLYIETAQASAERDPAAAAKVFNAAYDLLSQAVKADAKSSTAAFLLGIASYRSNRNDEAETNLKRALELDKRNGQAQVMLANVYIRKKNWEGALASLDAYLKDHAKAPDVRPIQETRAKIADMMKTPAK